MAARINAANAKSVGLYERAKKVMPGGCSRNTILRSPHPIYVANGKGCTVKDIEGKEYVDFANNMASLIHGHANPKIVEAVGKQLKNGTAFMMATEAELEFAEHMCDRNQGFGQIRFMNSGTEAVMNCIKVARAYTGRPMIAKVEGAYHGAYDYAEVSQTSNPDNWGRVGEPERIPVACGTPKSALSDVVVLPFNDPERSVRLLDRYAEQIACVLVDPVPHRVGLMPASGEYLTELRQWTNINRALLVFDEVVTFRSNYGGAQETLGIKPDLTALGKAIGGGFPIGAIAGRYQVMDVMNPHNKPLLVPQAGTFSANPISMTAGRVAMELFDKSEVERLNVLGEQLRRNLREAIGIAGVQYSITGFASMFRIHTKPLVPRNYREAFSSPAESSQLFLLMDQLLRRGYSLINTGTGMLSTPMTQTTIDRFSEVCLDVFKHSR